MFPRLLWEPIFTQAMSFLCHNFGQAMSNLPKWLLGDVKLNITRSPDPEILVFLHVWMSLINSVWQRHNTMLTNQRPCVYARVWIFKVGWKQGFPGKQNFWGIEMSVQSGLWRLQGWFNYLFSYASHFVTRLLRYDI